MRASRIRAGLGGCLRLLAGVVLLCGPLPLAYAAPPLVQTLRLDAPRERLPAPAFRLQALGGSAAGPGDYPGKAVLLHFWATFCQPCREELPRLQALAQAFGGQGLVVLSVAVDRAPSQRVADFVAEQGYRLPVLLDPAGEVRRRYEVAALPTSYLIAPDGRFAGRAIGPRDWDGAPALAAFGDWLRQVQAPR